MLFKTILFFIHSLIHSFIHSISLIHSFILLFILSVSFISTRISKASQMNDESEPSQPPDHSRSTFFHPDTREPAGRIPPSKSRISTNTFKAGGRPTDDSGGAGGGTMRTDGSRVTEATWASFFPEGTCIGCPRAKLEG